jgi:hypothetical protein
MNFWNWSVGQALAFAIVVVVLVWAFLQVWPVVIKTFVH